MQKEYKLALLIGRFEPFHSGHCRNFAQASLLADQLEIMIGSSYQPRTIKNPFTAQERRDMIYDSVWKIAGNTLSHQHIGYSFLRDYNYNDNLWIRNVQQIIKTKYPNYKDEEICILGYEKDDSSWYLHAFPKWKFIATDPYVEHNKSPIDATTIRQLYFEGNLEYIKATVPLPVFDYLKDFSKTEEYKTLVEEYNFIKTYKASWLAAPYAPTFFTVDSVVLQGGHILLVKRKMAPGKGLWALPGGFIEQKETARDACLRELKQETCLKVPEIVLRKGITFQRLFDKPDRSLRGRTITQAFLIELDGGDAKLPKVKGGDDAREAKWFSIAEIQEMSSVMFEDHYSIIEAMLARAE